MIQYISSDNMNMLMLTVTAINRQVNMLLGEALEKTVVWVKISRPTPIRSVELRFHGYNN